MKSCNRPTTAGGGRVGERRSTGSEVSDFVCVNDSRERREN